MLQILPFVQQPAKIGYIILSDVQNHKSTVPCATMQNTKYRNHIIKWHK
jgi:hypothetical protein